jgi:hypothetical protein
LPGYAHRSYTVTLWVKGNYVGQPDRRVYSESANTNNNPLLNIGTDSASSNAQPVVDIYIRDNNGGVGISHRKSSLAAFDDAWHHLAWVDDKGLARLYVDGVQDATDFSYSRTLLTPNIVSVGGIIRSNGLAAPFIGLIDDVAVWGRALTAEEVGYVRANGPVVAIEPAHLTQIEVTSSNVTLTFHSTLVNGTYRVEQSDTLSPASWSEVTGAVITDPADNTYVAVFARPPGNQKFYRVVSSH